MRAPELDQPCKPVLFATPERERLVRLCTRLTGDRVVAEDLVQETLLTAWQRRDQVTDPTGLSAWLAAIARNHYRHWVRSQRRCQQHLVTLDEFDHNASVAGSSVDADFDLAAALDQQQIVDLLDRAMSHLPVETQTLLVTHYVEATPQAELAAQLDIKAGAVAARLHRGKEMLRRLLLTKFGTEAQALGLIATEAVGWQATRIWCTACGAQRLRGKFTDDGDGQLLLQCDCGANHGVSGPADLLAGVRGYRPAWTRAKQWQHNLLQVGLRSGAVLCPCCHRAVNLQLTAQTPLPAAVGSNPTDEPGIWAHCAACGWRLQTDLAALAGTFPVSIQFGREHPRRKTLPTRQIDYEGAPALVVCTQSVTDSAQLELIFHTTAFALLGSFAQ